MQAPSKHGPVLQCMSFGSEVQRPDSQRGFSKNMSVSELTQADLGTGHGSMAPAEGVPASRASTQPASGGWVAAPASMRLPASAATGGAALALPAKPIDGGVTIGAIESEVDTSTRLVVGATLGRDVPVEEVGGDCDCSESSRELVA